MVNHLGFSHMYRIYELKREIKTGENVPFLSVIFLMAGNRELEDKISPFIDLENGLYHYKDLLSALSSNELGVLVKLTIALYNKEAKVDITDLSKLSQRNLSLALRAIKFCYKEDNSYRSDWGVDFF